MTCDKCTSGEIINSKGYTIRTCHCLMGILQKCAYAANTGECVAREVFGLDGDIVWAELPLCA